MNGQVILPPEPKREEMPEVHTLEDAGKLINYYEHLVQEWELWGTNVKRIIYKNSSQPE